MRKSIVSMPSARGFTLVELMIVIVIVAILAAIAIPGYTSQIRKSRRTEARNALLDVAAREERYYATNNIYSIAPSDLGYGTAPAGAPAIQWPVKVGNNYYQLTVSCAATAPNPCTDYTLTATAINAQQKDATCATLTLTSVGVQTSASATGAVTNATCWN